MILKSNLTYIRAIKGVSILPTLNKISTEQEKILKATDPFKHHIQTGEFVEIKDVPELTGDGLDESEKMSDVVSAMNAKNAKKMIADIDNLRDLKEISENDERDSVRNAAEKKLEKMTESEPEEK